jgi:hypothetical protein
MRSLTVKLLSGTAAVLPVLVIAVIISTLLFVHEATTFPIGQIVFIGLGVTLATYPLVTGYFLYSVATSPSLDGAAKTRWVMVILFTVPFGGMAYWYSHVWRDGEARA